MGFEDMVRTTPASNTSCSSDGVRLHGQTETDPNQGSIGMVFDAHVQVVTSWPTTTYCNLLNDIVIRGNSSTSLLLLVGTNTNYDQTKGNSASDFSFKGPDPYAKVFSTVHAASKKSYESILKTHIKDHQLYMHQFTLDLPDPKMSVHVDTTTLMNGYSTLEGDPFVEALIIDYSRYLFIGSSRPGSLPPNLQGNWAPSVAPAWSSDYHIDVNLQMYMSKYAFSSGKLKHESSDNFPRNHWHTEMMGLGNIMGPLWDYMQNTWVPRGTESAKLFYGADGWVTHTNINIFGHTA